MGRFLSKLFDDADESLSFDDILIKPAYSEINLREVDLSVRLNDRLSLSVPVFSAAMDTITGYEMARSMILSGGCGVLHRNVSVDENAEIIKQLFDEFGPEKPIAVSVCFSNTKEDVEKLVSAGANIIVVDSAHAHTKNIGQLVEMIAKNFPDVYLIAGNVVTREGAEWLVSKGAKAVKVGLGPGSICTTRKVTGIGRGQATAIADVSDYCKEKGVLVIADGGMRSSDEIMKAMACGADVVMLGYMLSGCEECPGEIIVMNGQQFKPYRGMGSVGAMKQGSASRYGKEKIDCFKWVPEGVEGYVPLKGKVQAEITFIEWSLKSAFGYIGARNISEAQKKSSVTRITNAVLFKSDIHSIHKIVKE